MAACPGTNTIAEWVCGDLATPTPVEEHVADCVACRKLVGALAIASGRVPTTTSGSEPTSPPIAPPRLLRPGAMVGRYEVRELLGAGGMGVVYAARDTELDRSVALKVLHPRLRAGEDHDAVVARLRDESKAMARLHHRNVATIHDIGEHAEQWFLVMELVRGTTLRERIGADWRTVIALFLRAGEGLRAAHEVGIVHCDFKPDNVLLDGDRPVVTDFGLARVLDTASVDNTDRGVFGTPAYMAPERFDAACEPDVQGDVFAFCVSLYEVLYGERPFQGATVHEMRDAVTRAAPRPRNTRVPRAVHRVVARGLAADRAVRYRTIGDVLSALERARGRRVIVAASAATIAIAAGIVTWGLAGDEASPRCDARQELAGIWDANTRATITAVLAKPGTIEATRLAQRVEKALDDYADKWVRASDASCSAPRAAHVADLERRCLRSSWVRLRTLTGMFAAGDAAAVKDGDRAVAALPSVDECGANEPGPPMPATPALRATVDDLRDELATAETSRLLSKFAEAGAALDALEPRVAAAGYKPLSAELRYARALNARGASKDPKAMATLLRETVSLAEASGNDVLVIKAWSALADDAAGIQGDFERAREYAGYARAALDRVGGSRRFEARLATMRGDIEWRDQKLEAARLAYQRAVELTTTDPAAQADAVAGLSKVNTRDGKLAEALAQSEQALQLRRAAYGVDSIPVARSYMAIADILRRLGRTREAVDHLRKADALVQQLYGPAHFMGVYTANDLANLLSDAGEHRDAEVVARRAVEIATHAYGADDGNTAKVRQTLGMVLREGGRIDEAIRELERALEGKRAKWGPTHVETISVKGHIAIALRLAGRIDESISMARATADEYAAALGPDNVDVAETLVSLAAAYLAANRTKDAADVRQRAREIFAKNEVPADVIETKLRPATPP